MARMPGVEYVPANDGNSRLAMKRQDIVCIHTIVGYFPAPAAHFSTRNDGWIRQHRDTSVQSAANLNGNPRVISIENEDHGPAYGSWSGSNVPPFTAAQCEAIARICAWANQAHGVPLGLCPDSRPGSRGIAYHRQGIDGNFGSFAYGGRVSGGEVWSSSTGKVCPGDKRISQIINTIIPRARALAGGAPLEEDDMTPDQSAKLDALFGAFYNTASTPHGVTVFDSLREVHDNLAVTDRAYNGVTIPDRLKAIAAGQESGGLDLDALADALADKVAERVAAKQAQANADELSKRLES